MPREKISRKQRKEWDDQRAANQARWHQRAHELSRLALADRPKGYSPRFEEDVHSYGHRAVHPDEIMIEEAQNDDYVISRAKARWYIPPTLNEREAKDKPEDKKHERIIYYN